MDVDLLRPGTVPISPDTVLWFEFLLSPSLLEDHLSRAKADPSPVDLIVSFMSIASEKDEEGGTANESLEKPRIEEPVGRRNQKSLALMILALKVAAHLKWDLGVLESKIPLPMQQSLLQSLLFFSLNSDADISQHESINFTKEPGQVVFAVTLYHRWVLRALMHSRLCIRQNRLPNMSIPGLQDPGNIALNVLEEIIRSLEAQSVSSLKILNSLSAASPPLVPVFDTFKCLTEDSLEIKHNWDLGIKITSEEFLYQLYYDLGSYHLFQEQYPEARENMQKAFNVKKMLDNMHVKLSYCSIKEETFNGYCQALELTSSKTDLLSSLQHSIHNQYTGVISVLQQDNVALQIPQMYRDILELDIVGALSSGKFTVARDLLFQVQTLNLVCRVLKGLPTCGGYWQKLNQCKGRVTDIFINAVLAVLPHADHQKKQKLKQLLYVGVSEYPPLRDCIIDCPDIIRLYSAQELLFMKLTGVKSEKSASDASEHMPKMLFVPSKEYFKANFADNTRLESGILEQQLISSYDTQEVHKLLLNLAAMNPGKVMWKVNNKWELPIPLQAVVSSLPRGLGQDYCYILLAKARELACMKDFNGALLFLSSVEKEAKHNNQFSSNLSYKLVRLVSWEILLIQINQFHAEWPSSNLNTEALSSGCKQCLSTLKAGDNVIPRLEVLEQCALCLLNLGQWEFLSSLEKRWNYFELTAALANACLDVTRFKGNKKVCKDAWDIILPAFGPPAQGKRGGGGSTSSGGGGSGGGGSSGSGRSRGESPPPPPPPPARCTSPATRAGVWATLATLREPTALAVAIALLARLHNALRDEPALELHAEHAALWPAAVSNANSYYVRAVSEMLGQVLAVALHSHPNNISWLKLYADLNFVMGHYSASLKCYLEVAVLVSDFFSQPLPRAIMDDHVYRRMIKCCTNLQCHTQAAVLCQFLEEVDYTTAFKSLGDTKSSGSCCDAMDAYYNCIWDTTILEYLVHLHNKRGETHRKQQAIKVIGLQELNASNNEEIQREAANVRKARFMRAMARQYLS